MLLLDLAGWRRRWRQSTVARLCFRLDVDDLVRNRIARFRGSPVFRPVGYRLMEE